MTISEFLEARIAEDEQQAEVCRELGWYPGEKYGLTAISHERIKAECTAKRAIIGWWVNGVIGYVEVGGEITNPLLPLASVYKDHPDYDPAWTSAEAGE
jgi:hypothetical protein